jgi:hypothetical protein
MAELTLPWVEEALQGGGTDEDRAQRVARALRGCGESPGYVEDWRIAGALHREDIRLIVELVTRRQRVTLATLCVRCRQYQGPECVELTGRHWAA